jgi:uncharacterized membrane protein
MSLIGLDAAMMAYRPFGYRSRRATDADEPDALPADRAGFFCHIGWSLFIVLILRSVSYAYETLGVSHHAAMWLLFASLLGSFFNIPIAELPPEQVMSNQIVDLFGMRYEVPAVSHWQGTIIAVNIGGAVIPTLVSIYLLIKNQLWVKGLVAITIVAVIVHWLATPVPGVGIALPVFMPAVITAIVAVVLSRRERQEAAPLAYFAGGLGTLIGADITNLDKVRGLGAPIASIGGAGTFDGIFLTGILAVLLASFYAPPRAIQM